MTFQQPVVALKLKFSVMKQARASCKDSCRRHVIKLRLQKPRKGLVLNFQGKAESCIASFFVQVFKPTEATAPVGVFVLHDDAVDNFAELLEVSLQAFVGRLVVQASDEQLAKNLQPKKAQVIDHSQRS